MNADHMNDDELRLAQVYATVPAPPTLRARYNAALGRARSGGHAAERRSLRPLAAGLAVAVVAAAGGVAAARLGFTRGHVAGPGPTPVRSATPNPTPNPTPRGLVIPWAALPPTGAYPQLASPSPLPNGPIPVPPGTPACRADQLEGAPLTKEAAAGNIDMPVALRNRSGTACVLEGYADVTVVDGAGNVVAPISGPELRGTFFDQVPAVPVLMLVGTPPLPSAVSAQPSRGQAVMNLTWYDCKLPQAARLWLALPNSGGRVVVPFPTKAVSSPACDGNPALAPQLSRGPLTSVGFTTPRSPDFLMVQVTISAPAQVRRGTTLVSYVTLSNTDSRPYQLDPCPDFTEFLTAKQPVDRHQLNCGPVGSVAPGAQVTFEIHLDVPATVAPGPNKMEWALIDGRVAVPYADAPITVVS